MCSRLRVDEFGEKGPFVKDKTKMRKMIDDKNREGGSMSGYVRLLF